MLVHFFQDSVTHAIHGRPARYAANHRVLAHGFIGISKVNNLTPALLIMAVGIIGLVVVRWRINILAMGEDEAKSLGINLKVLVGIVVHVVPLQQLQQFVSAVLLAGWVLLFHT